MNTFFIVVLIAVIIIQFFAVSSLFAKLRKTVALNKKLFGLTTELLNGIFKESVACVVKGSYYDKITKCYRVANGKFFSLLKSKK